MSAITDALRRASHAAKSSTAQTESPAPAATPSVAAPPPLPPLPVAATGSLPPLLPDPAAAPLSLRVDTTGIDISARTPERSRLLPILFSLLVLLCVAAAAGTYLYAKARGPMLGNITVMAKDDGTNDAEIEEAGDTEETTLASQVPNVTTAIAAAAPIASTSAAPATATATATAATPVPNPSATPGVPVRFPPLRLQSIFYRPSNPSVMINGKTLFISDEIQGVTVTEIKPASVTLVLSGQTNVLTLR